MLDSQHIFLIDKKIRLKIPGLLEQKSRIIWINALMQIPKIIFLQIMVPAQGQHMDYPKPKPMHIQFSWLDSTLILQLMPALQASLKPI